MTEHAVRVRGLRKGHGEVTAVDGVDLDIRRGVALEAGQVRRLAMADR
jgi:hypothetical protein